MARDQQETNTRQARDKQETHTRLGEEQTKQGTFGKKVKDREEEMVLCKSVSGRLFDTGSARFLTCSLSEGACFLRVLAF